MKEWLLTLLIGPVLCGRWRWHCYHFVRWVEIPLSREGRSCQYPAKKQIQIYRCCRCEHEQDRGQDW